MIIFRCYGGPAHNAFEVREWLEEFFRNHIIALTDEIEWPPRTPDLTSCDFFFIKCKVYVNPTQSIDDLNLKITQEMDDEKQDEINADKESRQEHDKKS